MDRVKDKRNEDENDIDLFDLLREWEDEDESSDISCAYNANECAYFDPYEFEEKVKFENNTSFFHLNCRGLSSNWEKFNELVFSLNNETFSFDFICISESFKCDHDVRLVLPGYQELISQQRPNDNRGGWHYL